MYLLFVVARPRLTLTSSISSKLKRQQSTAISSKNDVTPEKAAAQNRDNNDEKSDSDDDEEDLSDVARHLLRKRANADSIGTYFGRTRDRIRRECGKNFVTCM